MSININIKHVIKGKYKTCHNVNIKEVIRANIKHIIKGQYEIFRNTQYKTCHKRSI